MKLKFLLFVYIFGLLSTTSSIAQTNTKHSFKSFFSPDSLRGFDEQLTNQIAMQQGLYGNEYKMYMILAKKNYIINKYYPNAYNISNFKLSGTSSILNAPCVNEDFEAGNFTGWAATIGTNTNSCNYMNVVTPLPATAPLLQVLTTPLLDGLSGAVIPNSPLGGSKVAKINDNSVGAKAIKLIQNFNVTTNNYLYDFAYFGVQNGIHLCCDQPTMFVRLRDCVGNLLACPIFSFNAPSGMCPGTGPALWVPAPLGGGMQVSNGWQKYSIDLTPYVGSCVTIEVFIEDCTATGHFLYSYFDSKCNTMNLTVNGTSTVSMPSQTVAPQVACGTSATLTAPSGLNPYSWSGPPISGITSNTNQTISTSVAGNYTLIMTPLGVCTPIFRVINLSFVPPATVTASPASGICTSGSNTVATLTASGATSYTWSTGATTSTIAVSPTVTTVYSVTALTGSCSGVFTVQVNVNPSPTVNITASSTSVCAGQSTTLTGSGPSTYSWSTGSLTNTTTVNPASTTTYSVIGTSTAGCTGTATTTINVIATPTISAFNLSGTICAGSSANAVASGALSYTWNPGAIVGNVVSLTPTVTTTYTIIGATGACSSQTTLVIPVSNGPTLTVVASPAVICPGNSATLSASGALSYTWNPGAIISNSIVVSPIVTTNYSVTGVNAIGCTSTFTINEIVSPIPNITITPASSTICIGSSATLTASGASTYTWNPGSLTTAVVIVSPTTSTTYTIVGSNGTCTNSTTSLLTVVPIPTVTASSSTTQICSGSSATLTGSGATSYTWNPGSLIGTSVIVSPTITTTYTVIGSSGTCTNSAVVTLTVNNGPVITANASPTIVCAGNSSTLTASGAISYTWNPGALTGATVVVSPASTTLYSVIGNNALGCTTTKTVNVTVTPNPTVTASTSSPSICIGSSATLTASGATTYTWNPGAFIGTTFVVSPTVTTTYTVNGVTAGCPGQTTINISVVPIPTVNAVSSSTAICVGSSATLTASGALSYTWNPGSLTTAVVVVSPTTTTTYTVIGSNGGCTSTKTLVLIVNPTPTVTAVANPTSICVVGIVTLTASGALTYTWNPLGLTGSTVSYIQAVTTTYTVTGSSAAGCTNSTVITVSVNAVPILTVVATPTAICVGNSSTLTATGATNYTWNPGALTGSNVIVSPTVTTTYTVTGANGTCSNTKTITLIVNPNPTITATASPSTICAGSSSTLTATGAASYTWNPGALAGSTVVVNPITTTLYTVTGTSAAGCTSTQTVNLIVTPIPTVNAVANPTAICIGGSSTLTASGATTYSWNPGALIGTSVVVSPTVNTTYTVTGTTGICNSTQTVNVIVNPLPIIILVATPTAICAGSNATLSASGAVSYTWNPGSLTTSVIVVSPASNTTYTVIGANAFGCTSTQTINLIVNPNPTLTIVATPTALCSGNSATLTGSAIGGGPFISIWNPGAVAGSSIIITPSVTTTYTWSVTNFFGCSQTKTITINVTITPTVLASASNATICSGNNTTLTATGATSYTWNPGALTGSNVIVTPLINTTYTVLGANGLCTATQTLAIVVNPTPILTAVASPTNICSGSSATLTSTGAASYTWNPGALTGSNIIVSPIVTTLYTVTGSSGAGCTSTKTVNLIVTPIPTVIAVANPTAVCIGNSSTLTATGATSYTWNPGALTGSNVVVTPLFNTTYTVVGANGLCTDTKTVNVIVNPISPITAGALPNPICAGQTASLGAVGAITYTWNPGALTGSLVTVTPLITTNYTVTGTNAFGCNSSTVVTLTVNPLPLLNITSTATNICSGNSATLTGSGAASYTWNPGAVMASSIVVNPTVTTTYTLAGTSVFGCTNTATFNLSVTPTPTVIASASNLTICIGNSSTLTATGATNYTWNPGAITGSNVVVSPTVNTIYTVNGANGICVNSKTVSITVNPTPTVTISPSASVICSGAQLTLIANGASTYTWLPPFAAVSQTITSSPLSNTSYTVVGSSVNGCSNQAIFTVTVNTTPTVTAISSPTSLCIGNSATLTANGATSYTWLPSGATTSATVVNPTVSTTYTLTGSNSGCTNTTTLLLNVNPNPTVTASSSASIICSGNTVSLTASGASTYSWNPISLTGASVTNVPSTTTTYSVTGIDINGCSNQAMVTVSVNASPTVTAIASPTSICLGSTATLSASGALSYTWNPGTILGGTITVTPTITTNYTVTGADAIGCNNTQTLQLVVLPNPTVTAASLATAICFGTSATLTANGALTYTWQPGSITSATAIVTPTATTIYTLTGANGICGSATTTINIVVNPVPTASASVSGTISCTAPSVNLLGSATPTAVTYSWNGPFSYTSSVQNPTGISIPGNYTVTVTDVVSGCSSNATVSVITNSNVPTVTVSANGIITCANNLVTITAITSATNAGYVWTGPAAYTNTNSIITVSVGGNYSLTVTDLTANCPASTIITVFTNTNVPITATLIPATCSGTATNNNATIIASGFVFGDNYDYVAGTTYTGSLIYATAPAIPVTGILTNTLTNPFVITAYTVRFFAGNGCTKDTTLFLTPTTCLTNTVFGIAKAVSTPTLQTNGTYNVTYKVVVKNYSSAPLNNVVLLENLSTTFPLPTTFSIISTPTIITAASNLTLDATFDGTLQTTLTNTLSVLNANATDTILFSLNINPNSKFGPFNNTVVGFCQPIVGVVLADSSNTGINPDPDGNGNPTNNSIPTPLNLAPNLFFGITKVGTLGTRLADNTYDISYTITVHNLGNDTLHNVVLKDSLFNATIKQPATYTLKSGPIATGSLVANTSFNGKSDINLTIPSQSKLPPGFVNSISFTINVNLDSVTVVKNSAFGRALSTASIAVSDTSNNGTNPDINGNGIWNEASDNVPTVLSIPSNSLFVPQGFSPDGDNKNDLWVIKGLPVGVDNTVTVFNRWGNKVYQKTNYDNSWNGFPNVGGTLGNEKLPHGTYYYIIEFKTGDFKPLNGFVIIQY